MKQIDIVFHGTLLTNHSVCLCICLSSDLVFHFDCVLIELILTSFVSRIRLTSTSIDGLRLQVSFERIQSIPLRNLREKLFQFNTTVT